MQQSRGDNDKPRHIPIVSSAHLADTCWQFSELEYAMTMAYNAFSRWMTHCMVASGGKDLNAQDILLLHLVNHRTKEKSLTDLSFMLNVDNTHTINFSMKKLIKREHVVSRRNGKEMLYSISPKGEKLCEKYREVRQLCLIDALTATERNLDEIGHLALMLRNFSGLYDQASRAASSL